MRMELLGATWLDPCGRWETTRRLFAIGSELRDSHHMDLSTKQGIDRITTQVAPPSACPRPAMTRLSVLPNQRMKLSWRGGRSKGNGLIVMAAAAPRSLCAIR